MAALMAFKSNFYPWKILLKPLPYVKDKLSGVQVAQAAVLGGGGMN